MKLRYVLAGSLVLLAQTSALAELTLRITLAPDLAAKLAGPVSGRLVVGLIDQSLESLKSVDPNDAPLWDNPQPMLGADLTGLSVDHPVEIRSLDSFPMTSPLELQGEYRLAARVITTRASSSWRRDRGNLFGDPITASFSRGKDQTIELTLSHATLGEIWPDEEARALGAELVEVKSKLLSEFHHREVMLRACVVPPLNFKASGTYAAVYEVPDFGGDHTAGLSVAKRRKAGLTGVDSLLASHTFWITLDPESPNGHTLFADSANNGPCGKALTEELIPAIEAKFPSLVKKPEARLLRGHSSGGWSTLWLAITYPSVFGASWSTSPDPMDFRRLELIDIYGQRSAYQLTEQDSSFNNPMRSSKYAPVMIGDTGVVKVEFGGRPRVVTLGSFRKNGACIMTVEQEARGEDLTGPDNTSGQQWDSWMAVFGPRNERGHPAALFDPVSGRIDEKVAQAMKPYDMSLVFSERPGVIGPIFRTRIRLAVGLEDNFYLNEAVRLFKVELDRKYPPQNPDVELGYIDFIPKVDHGTIFGSDRLKGFPKEMVDHLQRFELMPRP